jgi:hypothetical protein
MIIVVFVTTKKLHNTYFLIVMLQRFDGRIVQVVFGLQPLKDLLDFLRSWVQHVHTKLCSVFGWEQLLFDGLLVGYKLNDTAFDKKRLFSYLQVIFTATY